MRAVAAAAVLGVAGAAAPAALAAPNPPVNPGDIVISEFRFHGPNGANDEFVELYNTTGSSIDLNSDEDNSVFWLQYWAPTPPPADFVEIVPAFDSDMAPRQTYLMTNEPDSAATGYSLAEYAVADTETDVTAVGDVPSNGGVALMYDPDVTDGINQRTIIDRAGFPGGFGGGVNYFEGVPEPAISALTTTQYSHLRKFQGVGTPTDTNSNSPDFELVAAGETSGAYGGQPAVFGAPGPQNRAAPYLENDGATPAVANDGMRSLLMSSSVSSGTFPNREYTAPAGSTPGTLIVRRRVVNNTGHPVSELRFRISQLTTYGAATSSQAILRSVDTNTSTVSGEPALGAKLNEPPNQTTGGGLNSSLFVNLFEDTGLSGGVLPAGGDVVVQFKFAVDRGGSFAFGYNHEAR